MVPHHVVHDGCSDIGFERPLSGMTMRRRGRDTARARRQPTHVDKEGVRAHVALCAFAGLRKGEAAAVQVGDTDFLRRQLRVSRQLQRDGATYVVRPPKYGSERVVYLPDDLVTILSEHVTMHLPDAEPGRWLFTVDDEPMYDNAITWRWRATRTAAKLPHVRLHNYAALLCLRA